MSKNPPNRPRQLSSVLLLVAGIGISILTAWEMLHGPDWFLVREQARAELQLSCSAKITAFSFDWYPSTSEVYTKESHPYQVAHQSGTVMLRAFWEFDAAKVIDLKVCGSSFYFKSGMPQRFTFWLQIPFLQLILVFLLFFIAYSQRKKTRTFAFPVGTKAPNTDDMGESYYTIAYGQHRISWK